MDFSDGSVASVPTTLDLFQLLAGYRSGRFRPTDVVRVVLDRIHQRTSEAEWTCLVPVQQLLQQAQTLEQRDSRLPLYGIPFSVKDNIHVEGLPTTAGCKAYHHYPDLTSPVVKRLQDLGALLIGKNTMDEFATGVVGVRSHPHPVNPFDPRYITGGSSSGSAVVVSKGCVTFSLGSDTGGSGRVPAALCNIVGFKPTPHRLSNEGMVYANRSIDCIPVFAKTVKEAAVVFNAALPDDTTQEAPHRPVRKSLDHLTIAIPNSAALTFFGDGESQSCFQQVLHQLKCRGCTLIEIDFSPFAQAGRLLFEGGYLNERYDSVGRFIANNPDAVDPVVASVILQANGMDRTTLWRDIATISRLKAETFEMLRPFDVLLTPTTGTIYRVDDVKRDPIELNKNMAYYTNFGNLLNMCVISVPGAMRSDRLPFGISLMLPGHRDEELLGLAAGWEESSGLTPGSGASISL